MFSSVVGNDAWSLPKGQDTTAQKIDEILKRLDEADMRAKNARAMRTLPRR